MIFRMALRNLFRNRWRSFITTSAMTFAVFIMIVYSSLMLGLVDIFRRNAIMLDLSFIQIHAPGYRSDPSIYKWIENETAVGEQLHAKGFSFSRRFYGFGLAASGMSSAGVKFRGVDLGREENVTDIHRHVNAGEWLDSRDPKGVVIGRKLAKTLNAKLGGEVIIVSQAVDGSMANDLYRVRGILKGITEDIDRTGFFMTESAFRDLMTFEKGPHEIAVRISEDMNVDGAAQQIRETFPELEATTWRQLAPAIAQVCDFFDVSLYILYVISYLAVTLVILNAALMAVFERIREYGIMKALGLGPFAIIRLVLLEIMFQTLFASILGCIGAALVVWHYQAPGIDMSRLTAGASVSGIAFDSHWRTVFTPEIFYNPVLFLVGMAILGAIYPGIKAAVIRPVKAIVHR